MGEVHKKPISYVNVLVIVVDCMFGFLTWLSFVGAGRFDRQLYVGPPNEVAREKIFKIQLRNTPYSPLVDLATLAARTPSYTGADISAVCWLAAMAALEVC